MRGAPIVVGLQIENEALYVELAAFFASYAGYRLQHTEDIEVPRLMIIDMDTDWHQTLARIQALRSVSPTTEIFVTAAKTDANTLLNVLRAGVQAFLPQPLHKEDLHEALQRFEARYQDDRPSLTTKGKLINILGSKGGIGTTTIAVNLAVSLQEINPTSSVVLVDLNLQCGDAALFLDLEPLHTFGDITSDPSRLDETFLASILSRHASGLYLLPSADRVTAVNRQVPEGVERALELLPRMFDYVIVDSGHLLDDITVTALNRPSTLFLISILTLPVVRQTKRLITMLHDLHYPTESIKVVINRYRSKHEISLQDFEKSLNYKPFWTIPNDYMTVSSFVNKGITLSSIDHRAKVTKSIKKLAMTLSVEGRKISFLSRFMKKDI